MTDRRDSGKTERPPGKGGRDSRFQDERSSAERVVAGLSILGTVLRASAWERAAAHELNPTQAQILALLLRGDSEGVTLAYLAGKLGVSGPTASDSAGALDKKGLIQKRPHPNDRRALAIRLTANGRRVAEELADFPAELVSVVRELPSDDEARFLRLLVTLVRELETRGLAAPHRACVTCRFFEPDAGDPDSGPPYYCAFARAPFDDLSLRLDCQDHEAADPEVADANWRIFSRGGS